MNDEKIFGEIKGIFGQIEVRNELDRKKIQQNFDENGGLEELENVKEPKDQLREFFQFLKMEQTVKENEIDALIDLANYKKHENDKKNLDNNKKPEDYLDEPLTHEDLLRVFLVDQKQAEKEQKDLQNAFRILTSDYNDECIDLHDLQLKLKLFDKDHEDSIPDIINELKNAEEFLEVDDSVKPNKEGKKNIRSDYPRSLQRYEQLVDEIDIPKGQMKFNYKEYLNKQFKSTK